MARYSYKTAFDELVEYAKSEGYQNITFGGQESFIFWAEMDKDKKLNIEDGETYENMVYLILHELGHHQIRKNWPRFQKRLPVVAFAEQLEDPKKRKHMRRDSYIVSCLEEEFVAWEEGHKLAGALGIHINTKKWVTFKARKLKAHINHSAKLNK